jgi:bifunctional UDP-N-acetylglucosamine pyrophosphorylase/glucosamine-1-phosphate N-acetyltransferase
MENISERRTSIDVLIMAAGLGTRMKSSRAKVLHLLDGRPLINHVCEAALTLSPEKIIVVVGHQADDVKRAVLDDFDLPIFEFPVQERQLGTGDAVNAARGVLTGRKTRIVVLSGDVPLLSAETLSALVKTHDEFSETGAVCTVLSVKLEDPTGYGRVLRDGGGAFERIVEQKDATEDQRLIDEINSGIYCFDSEKLLSALERVGNANAQGEYYLTDVPGILQADGEAVAIFECHLESEVEGVNDRVQLARMEGMIRRNTISSLMLESGVSFVDPGSAFISSRASIGRDTVICQNVTVEGAAEIGERCILRPGTRIVDAVIGDDVEVKDNSLITGSRVGSKCTVGPMAHLRGAAVMDDGSKVGNFVELKKTRLGRGSKASHLTYLGDATIGEKTNIGAGTITCNYDGKDKHETHIGNNVKIGSDTMLVAPIKVGDGASTGAGSVVTKDIEPEMLVAGVPAKPLKKKETQQQGDEAVEQFSSPEQVSAEESLNRMNSFAERKENLFAAVQTSEN